MEWNKARFSLIGLLLAVNLFLYGFGLRIGWQKTHLSAAYLQDAVTVLDKNGIGVSAEQLSSRRLVLPRYEFQTRDMLLPLITACLGELSGEPGAQGEGTLYRSERGSLLLLTSSEWTYTPADLSELPDLKAAQALLLHAGVRTEELAACGELCMQQQVEGLPCVGYGLVLDSGRLTGRLLLGGRQSKSYPDLLDAPNALLRFAEYARMQGMPRQEVRQVQAVYLPAASALFGTITLTPGYLLATQQGEYLIDGVSGAVTPHQESLAQSLSALQALS